MSAFQLILRSLWFHWRLHLAVALGVMASTAVLTGALLVGDSVRGSLRGITLERLGRIDETLVTPRFFRARLADELAADKDFKRYFDQALPAIVLRASLLNPNREAAPADGAAAKVTGFSGRVDLYGVPEAFWRQGAGGPEHAPRANEVVLNRPLADELRVKVGDEVSLKLQQYSLTPAESTFGRTSENIESRNLTVSAIIPAEGLGRFGVRPNQQLPLNAFTNVGTLQNILDQPERVNAMFVTGLQAEDANPPAAAHAALQAALRPKLTDYGLTLEETPRDYFNLTSNRMMLDQPVEKAASKVSGAQPALVYLANLISAGPQDKVKKNARGKIENAIPYSIVAGVDFDYPPPLGPWVSTDGETIKRLADDEIVLNQWAFDDLNKQLEDDGLTLKVGDTVRLTYFEPEHIDGGSVETTRAFKLRAVVPLSEDSPANDRNFTPSVPGVTDQESIENWDAPFEYEPQHIRKQDEDYWDAYRGTPKAFVSLRTGQRLWGTRRFGQLTSVRFPPEPGRDAGSLAKRLDLDPQSMGFLFQPSKAQGLAAASGTTPFSVLFMSFSFFIIASAVMLVALLFRLGIENRATQIGLLLAVGVSRKSVRRLLAVEGLFVAGAGGLLGVAAGAGYAWVMLYGLRNWWVGAISTPFLHLHVWWVSFVIGYAAGVVVSFVAIWWSLRRLRGIAVRRLLAGQAHEADAVIRKRPRIAQAVAAVSLIAAIALGVMAATLGGGAQAGAFFGSGSMVLIAGLAFLWSRMRRGASGKPVEVGASPLARLAARNGARNPSRSTLTIGLVASATFLVVALAAFQMDPSQQAPQLNSGNGGFSLVAESASPIYKDLNDPENLIDLGGLQDSDLKKLAADKVFALRVLPGEDASCLNLYQTTRPRVLGVPAGLIHRGGFAWAGTSATTPEEKGNPWLLLESDQGQHEDGQPFVPVVMDMNTAMYSLHLYSPGATLDIQDDWGRTIHLKLVGMLSNSLFQGDVLMSESQFLHWFPEVGGDRFFLIQTPTQEQLLASLDANKTSPAAKAGWPRLAPSAALTSQETAKLSDSPAPDKPAPDKPVPGKWWVDTAPAGGQRVLGPFDNTEAAAGAAADWLTTAAEKTLESGLSDTGFDTQRTGDRLAGFLAVQNTYISTFQSLGLLGVLLGTFGLATVQLRNVLERRGELALMRATGFRKARLAWLVLAENSFLLVCGLAVGGFAALVAIAPTCWAATPACRWPISAPPSG